jgi:CarD family transcriptional regulator
MYNVGDDVVYPMHGAGIIEKIEERYILEQTRSYYVLRFDTDGMTVMVPVDNVAKSGLRNVVSTSDYDKIMEGFKNGEEIEDSANWNRRYRENMEKIKTGDVFETAAVVKSLVLRENRKGLSSGEKKMLLTAMQILVSELSVVSGESIKALEKKIVDLVC